MFGRLNEKPFKHSCQNGCVFTSDRCDLKNGVVVLLPEGISQEELCADSAEFAGYHAVAIREDLNGFAGYDAIHYTFRKEKA